MQLTQRDPDDSAGFSDKPVNRRLINSDRVKPVTVRKEEKNSNSVLTNKIYCCFASLSQRGDRKERHVRKKRNKKDVPVWKA